MAAPLPVSIQATRTSLRGSDLPGHLMRAVCCRRLTGDQGKFSIRAGAGIYYNQVEEELSLQNLTAPPFSLRLAVTVV